MARLPLALPPGVFRDGTQYQSKGRWYDASLVRWYGAALGPVNGWRRKGTSLLIGMARAAIAWTDNSKDMWMGVGTHSKLYVCNRAGAAFDITPIGLIPGRADAIATGGYGLGPYGTSTYGTPRPATATTIVDATEWTLDTWGEDMVGVSPADRKIYEWTAGATASPAVQVSNSPDCDAVIVTAERFMFALGTSDPRTLDWCDQEDNTLWAPASTNQAGSFPLQTAGRLMCGKRVKGGTLLLTDQDAHMASYIGGTLVYGFDRVGDDCGVISRQGAASFDQQAVWMSPTLNFFVWNGGGVIPLHCDVQDYIRRDVNITQASKVVAIVNSGNFEIEFRYCSASSNEIDRCVIWQYKDNYWNIGRVARTCGVDKVGAFSNPILISTDGKIYDHELGWAYDAEEPTATSGPIELGNGDNIMWVMGLYPDDATVGDVTASFNVRRNMDDPGTDFGPYDLTAKTDLRFSGGLVEMTVTGDAMASWRVGVPKLDLEMGEGRD
jgi:hypothetical protein